MSPASNPAANADQKNNEYSSRFGEPVPTLVMTLVVAPFTIAYEITSDWTAAARGELPVHAYWDGTEHVW